MRPTASSGIRSKFTSSTVGSLIRTPSRKTLTPCGSPVTGDTTNPRSVRVGCKGFPCSFWRVTPGRRSSRSGRTIGRDEPISAPWRMSAVPGTQDRGNASGSGAGATTRTGGSRSTPSSRGGSAEGSAAEVRPAAMRRMTKAPNHRDRRSGARALMRRETSRTPPVAPSPKGSRGYPAGLSWPFTARTTCSCPHSITRLTGMPWMVLDTMSGRM